MLSFTNVSYQFQQQTLLHKISFKLGNHGCVVLLGHNGAGKTLSLMLAHGLLSPSHGSIHWHDTKTRAIVLPTLLRRSVLSNVMYPLILKGFSHTESRQRAEQALTQAGLAHLMKSPARSCSAGEKQLIALARACVTKPKIMLLDEPTANLDPSATQQVDKMLQQIITGGAQLLLATHDWSQAKRLASEVLLLRHGKLIENKPAQQFFKAHPIPLNDALLEGNIGLKGKHSA